MRILKFNLGKINIITGRSKTGKSAILSIVEYCLGRSDFNIPAGIIRETVAWYGVLFNTNKTDIFVCKPPPKKGESNSQSQAFLKVGVNIEIPSFSELKINSNDESIKHYLGSIIGIKDNLSVVKEQESRAELETNLSHTNYYLFQGQNVIANKDIIIHY